MWLLMATGFVGAGIGVAAFVALDRYMPLYSGEVLFEIRSGLDEASDVGSRDIAQEDLVNRLASTETVLLTSRGVLMAAVKEPDVQKTTWFKQNFIDGQVRLLDDAVDELEDDVVGKIVRGTNLFGLKWSTGEPTDVPDVLNTIAQKYLDERYSQDNQVYEQNRQLYSKELSETNRQLDDLAPPARRPGPGDRAVHPGEGNHQPR
jgi:hypothetical protein